MSDTVIHKLFQEFVGSGGQYFPLINKPTRLVIRHILRDRGYLVDWENLTEAERLSLRSRYLLVRYPGINVVCRDVLSVAQLSEHAENHIRGCRDSRGTPEGLLSMTADVFAIAVFASSSEDTVSQLICRMARARFNASNTDSERIQLAVALTETSIQINDSDPYPPMDADLFRNWWSFLLK